MKIKPLKITFESVNSFAAKSTALLKDALNHTNTIQKKDILVWSSVESYQKFMSDQKYTILAAIYKFHPQSVYQLAKILNRAQQNVARDCDLLEGHGFIKLIETEDGRKMKAPKLSFDYNAILVCMPSISYKIEFEEVA